MWRIGRYAFLTWAAALPAASLGGAQDSTPSASSTVPASARFEIVQSPLLAKLAFRLDRYTGETWQFVKDTKGGYGWQRVQKIDVPNDVKVPDRVNYQIFMSGILAQVTLLINTNTGVSWYIAEDPRQGIFWSPME